MQKLKLRGSNRSIHYRLTYAGERARGLTLRYSTNKEDGGRISYEENIRYLGGGEIQVSLYERGREGRKKN